MSRTPITVIALLTILSACRPPEAPPPPDVRVLLRTSRYDEALAEAEQRVAQERTARNLALLAAARAALALPAGSLESAADALLQAITVSSRGEVAQIFAEEISGSMAFQGARFLAASRVTMALAEGWEGTTSDVDAMHGAAALLNLAAYGSEHNAPAGEIAPLVQAAVALLEHSTQDLVFPDNDMHTAWVCFRSAGVLASATGESGSSTLSHITSEIALRIIESNPQLSIAVACDLSSPRNQLRDVLRRRHDADSLARLSALMADAEGCSLGTYAP